MNVDAITGDAGQASTVDPAVVANTPVDTGAPDTTSNDAPVSDDQQMERVWDRMVRDNGAEREGGRFVSPDPAKRTAETPLEGGAGEAQAAPESGQADVPLPANWVGKEGLWAKLPAETKAEIAEHQREQHVKLSEMGREVAAYRPLHSVGKEVSDYIGQLAAQAQANGQEYTGPKSPAEGIAYLFNIQRSMDRDPGGTILSIIDTYGARDQVAALLGLKAGDGSAPPQPLAEVASLKSTIGRLEAKIQELSDPSRIEKVVDDKTARSKHDEEVSRLTSSKPLYSDIDEETMVFFINKAWKKLGPDADKAAVFDHAYNAAVEADPALRAKSQAAANAADDAAKKAGAAKRGASVNLKTTAGTGTPRPKSDDEAMEEVWSRHHA